VRTATSYRTPPIPDAPLPDIGDRLIPPERFHSRQWMDREWSALWKTVWNLGVREMEIPEPGDYLRHSLGKEDLIFMRGDDSRIRAFYNVCRHRGNQLCQGARDGHLAHIQCPYHGWTWNRDGTLKSVSDPQFFKAFREGGVPAERLGLFEVKIETWAGWVWFNLDPDAVPLRNYLSDIMDHVAPYQMEKWQVVDFKTLEWNCNWKHAVDAFLESYHFEALHPQLLAWANGHDIPIELMGMHSRMYNYTGTLSPQIIDRTTLSPAMRLVMQSYLGVPIDPDTYQGSPEEVFLEVRRRKRAIQHETYLPYAQLADEQLSEICHYGIFPNVIWAMQPEGMVMFRPRPHESDPGRCYYDLLLLAHNPPGTPQPEYEHRSFGPGEAPSLAAVMNIHPVNAEVLEQDAANLEPMQRGTASDIFDGMMLCDQEIRVRHFHNMIDAVLDRGGW
jgi:phenylpropionate dioxygenase-like ring-hydroxylating dioxygenase large terminal subunit